MTKKLPPTVEVIWKDSRTNSTGKWSREDLKHEPDFILTSAGYLMHRNKRGINIASEYRKEDKLGRHVQHIPAAMVLKVKKLK